MSKNWVRDIEDLHDKFKFHDKIKNFTPEQYKALLQFRFKFLDEELEEGFSAITNKDPEEICDSLIDLCVVAIGTMDLFGIDKYEAWDRVHKANMSKEPGIKPGRPNPLGLPDLMKPSDWEAPSHEGNHGKFTEACK